MTGTWEFTDEAFKVEGEVTCTFTDAELYAAVEAGQITVEDILAELQLDTGVLETYELPIAGVVRGAEDMGEVIEMEADAYYGLAWLRNADASSQIDATDLTVNVAIVI